MSASSDPFHLYFMTQIESDESVKLNAEGFLHKRGDFLTSLNYYLSVLKSTDKVMISYLDLKRKQQLKHDLQMALVLLRAQNEYEYKHQKTENQKIYAEHIVHCNILLDAVNFELISYSKETSEPEYFTNLNYYLDVLNNTDKTAISYWQEKEKEQLKHNLNMALLQVIARNDYDLKHNIKENKETYIHQIKRYNELLDALNPALQAQRKKAPEQEYFTDGIPVKYCAIPFAHEFAKQLTAMMDRKSKTLKESLGALNDKRLYWIWGSSFLKTMLSLLPEDFYNAKIAAEVVRAPDLYTGALSWGLYYFRFSLNLFLLMKHTIKHPWMSEEEATLTPDSWQRFKTQWNLRKFTLLNDSLWGTANLLCYFWLVGPGTLGAAGDALTIALLIFDITVALWDFAEQEAQYNEQINDYNQQILSLNEQKESLESKQNQEEYKRKVALIDMQIASLHKKIEQCEYDWKLQKLSLYNNVGYAVGLMLAFVLLTMPFMPIAASTAFTLNIVGSVLCFAMTVISNGIKGGIEVYKGRQGAKEARDSFDSKIEDLKTLLLANNRLNDNKKKLVYLEIKKLQAETEYQEQVATFQMAHLVRSVIIEALVPVIVFTSTVFLPLGMGFNAMGAALGLAMGTNSLINTQLSPDENLKELPPFDEKEYSEFCDLVNSDMSSPKSHRNFFNERRKQTSTKDNQESRTDSPVPSNNKT
ncbi:MAG: hypothetical protein QM652_12590 [Legionella sp.]|uniref:hypothetical protein n=1 Tax=Legionella sp. TaxID=459 RepID=UPI0039E6F06E